MLRQTTLNKQRIAEVSSVQAETFDDVKTRMWALPYSSQDVGEVVFTDVGDVNAGKKVPDDFRRQVEKSMFKVVVCPKSRIGWREERALSNQGFIELESSGDYLCLKNE